MVKVRLLWVGYSGKPEYAHSKTLNKLVAKELIDFCAATGVKRHPSDSEVLSEPLISHHDALFAKYEEIDSNFALQVDQCLIKIFSPFEGETLRMMDRLHGRGPKYRFIDSFDDRRIMFLKHCSFWYHYLRSKKVSHIIFNGVPHEVFTFVIYQIAKQLGINTIIFSPEKIGIPRKIESVFVNPNKIRKSMHTSLFFVSSSLEDIGIWSLSEQIKAIGDECTSRLINGNPFQEIDLFLKNKNDTKQVQREVGSFIETQKRLFSLTAKRPIDLLAFMKNAYVSLMQVREHKRISRVFKSDAPAILFCLAYQPEESTSPRSGIFVEQIIAIELVSRLIPSGWTLRVREHPDQYSRGRPRPYGFLRKISEISNVEIVPMRESVNQSLRCARAVVVNAGSMGLEAWNCGIPVILLGHMLLKKAPGVTFVQSKDELEAILRKVSIETTDSQCSKEEFKHWTSLNSYVGSLQKVRDHELFKDTVQNLSALLHRWFILTSVEVNPSSNNYLSQG